MGACGEIVQNDEEKKKSRETKSKSQNVWFDVCIPSIKRNAHFVDR